MRQAGALVGLERLLARDGDLACAGQPIARDRKKYRSARVRFQFSPMRRS
jgi:hypothetical protein